MNDHDRQFMLAFLKRISNKLMKAGFYDEAERADYLVRRLEVPQGYTPAEEHYAQGGVEALLSYSKRLETELAALRQPTDDPDWGSKSYHDPKAAK